MHAYLDLEGVILNHQTRRVLPLMDDFLRGLKHKGWDLNILTSHQPRHAEALMGKAGLTAGIRVVSSAGRGKGTVLAEEIERFRPGQVLFLDDKPENLDSVKRKCGEAVRVVGFVGSRKYCPELSEWCARHAVELALSVPDLIEGLQVSCEPSDGWVKTTSHLSEEDVALLVPGLDHPGSAIAGDTGYFDHRAVLVHFQEDRPIRDFERLWENIAWITCGECLLKIMIETGIKFLRLERADVLKGAYKYSDYLVPLRRFSGEHPEIDFKSAFAQAFACVDKGLARIGIEAQSCRISGRPIELERLVFAQTNILDCLERRR